jgi:hypothetical protein
MSKEKHIEDFLECLSKDDLVGANEKLNLAARETLQGIINNKKQAIADKLSEKAQTLALEK